MNLRSSRAAPGRRPRRPALRDRQRDEVSRAIVDATELVIAARGLADASMAEVAREAGVAVGTVYNHFADRDALVRALFADRRGRIVPALRAASEPATAALDADLRGFVGRVLTVLGDHARFVRIAFEVGNARGRELTPRTPTVLGELRAAAERVLARHPRELGPRHAALLAPILLGALRAIVVEELADGGFARHADALVDLFLDGARRR